MRSKFFWIKNHWIQGRVAQSREIVLNRIKGKYCKRPKFIWCFFYFSRHLSWKGCSYLSHRGKKTNGKVKKALWYRARGEGLEPNKTTAKRFGALQFIASRSKSSNISSYLSVNTIQDTGYRGRRWQGWTVLSVIGCNSRQADLKSRKKWQKALDFPVFVFFSRYF